MVIEPMRCRRGAWLVVVLASLAALLGGAPATRADGGVVRLSEARGNLLVTVFTAPTPLRAGPVDVSVMVQESAGHRPVLDASVSIVLRSKADHAVIHAVATRAQATNKLLYAALVDLPVAGDWDLAVTVEHGSTSQRVETGLFAGAPVPDLLALWPYLAFPPMVIALFVLHQRLGRSGGSRVHRAGGGGEDVSPSIRARPGASGMSGPRDR